MPLEHALVLTKHLLALQTENYELESLCKEMKAKLGENQIQGSNKDATTTEDADDSSDDSDVGIVPGGNMLEQIFNLQS